ncbi:MAG: DUF4124 domain-containing protein [Enterobacterales bacterium]|nr:DUF4124 domain-containing protein [Enterobacterales bacterium]
MKSFRMVLTTLILVCLTTSHAWSQVYKWVDENGKVHFGDQPPNKEKAETIDLPEQPVSEVPTVTDAERRERQKRLVKALEEERLEKQKAKEEKKKKEAKRKTYCAQLKARVKDSERIGRFYRYDENGEREYISDEQADAFRKSLKDEYQSRCSG